MARSLGAAPNNTTSGSGSQCIWDWLAILSDYFILFLLLSLDASWPRASLSLPQEPCRALVVVALSLAGRWIRACLAALWGGRRWGEDRAPESLPSGRRSATCYKLLSPAVGFIEVGVSCAQPNESIRHAACGLRHVQVSSRLDMLSSLRRWCPTEQTALSRIVFRHMPGLSTSPDLHCLCSVHGGDSYRVALVKLHASSQL